MFSFRFADFEVPRGQIPRFDQLLALPPSEAIDLRKRFISDELRKTLNDEIYTILESLIRASPFGKTFVTTAQLVREAKERNGGIIPRFRVIFNN